MPIPDEARREQAGRSASYREPGVIIGLPAPHGVGLDRPPAVADGAGRFTSFAFTTWTVIVGRHGGIRTNSSSEGIAAPSSLPSQSPRKLIAERYAQCPSLPRNWWPAGAVSGYCEATEDEGDCETGSKGSFKEFERRALWRSEPLSIQDCAAMCSRCKRCNFFSVSLSPDVTDCSWFHSCDRLQRGRLPRLRGANFVTVPLRSAQRYAKSCRAHYGSGGVC